MMKSVAITENADGRRGACLDADDSSLVGKEAMALSTEGAEAFLQAHRDERRHPEMEGRRDEAWCVAAFGQVVAEASVDEVSHTLGRNTSHHRS